MKRSQNYRKAWIDHFGKIPRDENGRSYEIHHKDGNAFNDNIENLECITIEEHYQRHFDAGQFYACACIKRRMNMTEEQKKELSQRIAEANKNRPNPMESEETRKKVSKSLTGKYVGEKNHGFGKKRPDHSKRMKELGFGKNKTEEHKRNQALSWIESTKDNPVRALSWKIQKDEKEFIVKNLKKFCKENSISYSKFYNSKCFENFVLLGKV